MATILASSKNRLAASLRAGEATNHIDSSRGEVYIYVSILAKERPMKLGCRRIILDYHFSSFPPRTLTAVDAADYARRMKEAGVESFWTARCTTRTCRPSKVSTPWRCDNPEWHPPRIRSLRAAHAPRRTLFP
jgi:hypothetical protein